MKLSRLGEDSLLARLLPRLPVGDGVIAGAGDDVAVVHAPGRDHFLLLKTDCVVEGVHFKTAAPPAAIGWKAMMRPLSDFAAVSGLPQFALVTLVIGRSKRSEWVEKIYGGLKRAAARFKVSVVGGETSSTRGPTVISVSVSGFVEKSRWVARSRGRAGDSLFVTGRLGGAGKNKHLRFVPRIEQARWLTEHFSIHAMMDLSDGLAADLPRLARASRLSFQIETDRLPLTAGATIENAISDGEDYELLFAISSRAGDHLRDAWKKRFPRIQLTRIGRLLPLSAINVSPARANRQLKGGYVHFQ
ncbi:MAG: thiamine-monophosphate kinase [Verrucomicrobiota bacterium]|jgi:thiamine-monophosphate kinase